MNNPPSSGSSYEDLFKKIMRSVQSAELDDQFIRLLQQTFEAELAKENVVLSRPERARMYRQLAANILNAALEKVTKLS